jgi:hypothetical protein
MVAQAYVREKGVYIFFDHQLKMENFICRCNKSVCIIKTDVFKKLTVELESMVEYQDNQRRFALYQLASQLLDYKQRQSLLVCVTEHIGARFPAGKRTGFKNK